MRNSPVAPPAPVAPLRRPGPVFRHGSRSADVAAFLVADWPAWMLHCFARTDGRKAGYRTAVIGAGVDRLGQSRFRLLPATAVNGREPVAVCRHNLRRTVHRTVSGWVVAARHADRGLGLGIVHAVVRGETSGAPDADLGEWIEKTAARWVDEECGALVCAARWALAVDRWAEAAALGRLVRAGSSAPPAALALVERAIVRRRCAAAAGVSELADVLFRPRCIELDREDHK